MDIVANPFSSTANGRMRKTFKIKEYLELSGISAAMIAQEAGVSQALVSNTIRGKSNNKKVLLYLQKIGCPIEYLSIPKEMQNKGK